MQVSINVSNLKGKVNISPCEYKGSQRKANAGRREKPRLLSGQALYTATGPSHTCRQSPNQEGEEHRHTQQGRGQRRNWVVTVAIGRW